MASEASNLESGAPKIAAISSSWLRPELVASWREIAIVLALTTGYYIYCSSVIALYHWGGHSTHLHPTNYGGLRMIAELSAILALLLLYLARQGWNPRDLKINVGWLTSLLAVPLWIADVALLVVGLFLAIFWIRSHPSPLAKVPYIPTHITHLSWIVAIPHEVINAYFEEVVCMSYAFNQFAAKRGPLLAVGLTVLLRLSYHIWKSPIFIGVAAVQFTLFGLWYWRVRSVWPLILAHICYGLSLDWTQIH